MEPFWTAIAGVGAYWREVSVRAFWESLVFFEATPKNLFLCLVGMAVTALVVWSTRTREAFMEHLKANIAIVLAGGVAMWLPVFVFFLVADPATQYQALAESCSRLSERERSATLRKEGDVAIIAQQHSEIAALRSRRPPATGVRVPPDADILCQKLENCPSPELRKRALNLANELDDLYQQYYKESRKQVDAEHRAPHEAVVRGMAAMMSARYRSDFEPDVIRYRKVIIDRLPPGSVDHSEDHLYDSSAPGWFSMNMIENVNEIAGSLRHIAALLPEH